MTGIHVIENKISSIRRYLEILDSYRKFTLDQLKSDVTLRGAVERYLYLLAQATIDLAEAVIALRKLRKPSTLDESFAILQEAGMLPASLATNLARMAAFRNLLAHDYERLDYDIVYNALQTRLSDAEQFVEVISKTVR